MITGKLKEYIMNPKVEFYFSNAQKWQEEINKLRTIVLQCGLTEELKWEFLVIPIRKATSF